MLAVLFFLLTLVSSCASIGDTVGDDTVSVAIETEPGQFSDEQLIERAIEFEPAFRALIYTINHLNEKRNSPWLSSHGSEFVSIALSSLLTFREPTEHCHKPTWKNSEDSVF